MIPKLILDIFSSKAITKKEALMLVDQYDSKTLAELANEVRKQNTGNSFHTCSIINAKSGNCSENCKWCAQSVFHKSEINKYELVDTDIALKQALYNEKKGVNRFSLVTSGKTISNESLDKLIGIYTEIGKKSNIALCASMGLLDVAQLQKLHKAGVTHYHCNLETSRHFFPELCTTHTYEQKIEVLKAAQNIGMDVCSGGIIGMGETMDARIDMAIELRELGVLSIPINVLVPLQGTALEKQQPLSDDEIIKTFAIFRIINPLASIRFAGGRCRVEHILPDLLKAGVNGAIVGDLLTTVGSGIDEDMVTFSEAGFEIHKYEPQKQTFRLFARK